MIYWIEITQRSNAHNRHRASYLLIVIVITYTYSNS